MDVIQYEGNVFYCIHDNDREQFIMAWHTITHLFLTLHMVNAWGKGSVWGSYS
jgi:hypothetical protein